MGLLKGITDFFLSLRTTLWILVILLLLFLAGAVFMPLNDEYRLMSSVPLFQWLRGQPSGITWWLWASIGMLSILTINTILCSIESLLKKGRATKWLILIAPQIIHIGFLFVLFAHLLDASESFKYLTHVREGTVIRMDNGVSLKIKDIDVLIDTSGFIRDWKVDVEYLLNDESVENGVIAPNSPFLKGGFNVIVKKIRLFPLKTALLQISKELGAIWALTGGLLIMIGIVILILFKIRVER